MIYKLFQKRIKIYKIKVAKIRKIKNVKTINQTDFIYGYWNFRLFRWYVDPISYRIIIPVGYCKHLHNKLFPVFRQWSNFVVNKYCVSNNDDMYWLDYEIGTVLLINHPSNLNNDSRTNSNGTLYLYLFVHVKFLDIYFVLWNSFWFGFRKQFYDSY